MTANESNLLGYMALMVVKILARDLGKRAMEGTMGAMANADVDIRHLERLCTFIHRYDPKLGETALKIVARNGPRAQEQEILKSARAAWAKAADVIPKDDASVVLATEEDEKDND